MSPRALLLCVVASGALAQPRRVPFAFDAGLPASPVTTQQKLTALEGKLPPTFALPAAFQQLASAPDGVTTPTTQLWVSPEMTAAWTRAASSGPGPMTWPGSTRCARHQAFALPVTTLLASGASSACATVETTLRAQLAPATTDACVDVDMPERYALASAVPSGLSQTQLNSFVDQRTQTLEQQLALAGAGLSTLTLPDGLLPSDWVPTLRSVLWKLRESAHATRLAQARTAYASALSTLSGNATCFDATKRATLETQVQQLDAELVAVGAHVSSVVSAGLARASQQASCLGARARTRPTLPVPSLTDEEREFIGFWLGGVFWRMRGGGLLQLGSTQNARTFFARRPLREIARIANGTSTGDRAADSLYCALFDGWGDWMDVGTTPGGQDMYEDLVQLTDRGRQQVADWTLSAIGAALANGLSNSKSAEASLREAGFATTDLYAGGLAMGPCYLYALNPMKTFTSGATATAPYAPFLEGFTAHGEFCFGASLGLGLTRSFLNGTPTNQAPTSQCGARRCGVDACGMSCGSCATGLDCDGAGQCVAPPVDAGVAVDGGLEDGGLEDGGLEDGGLGDDAGVDAGTGSVDAGDAADASIELPDAGAPFADAGFRADAGTSDPASPMGCGCGAAPEVLPVLLALGLLRRRRRGAAPLASSDSVPGRRTTSRAQRRVTASLLRASVAGHVRAGHPRCALSRPASPRLSRPQPRPSRPVGC